MPSTALNEDTATHGSAPTAEGARSTLRPVRAVVPVVRRRWRLLVVLATVTLIAPTAAAWVHLLGALETVAVDRFDRVVSEGWGGNAQVAGYELQGPATDFEVDGASATISLPNAGAGRGVVLNGIEAVDVDITFRVSTEERPTGTALFVYSIVRRGSGTAYRPKVLIGPEGSVTVHAGVMVGDRESPVGAPVRVTGLRFAPGVFIWVRAQVLGTSPTTIRVRAWRDGRPEPTAWSYTGSDQTVELQGSGGIGVHAYLSSSATAVPLNVRIDDLTVRARSGPPPSLPSATAQATATNATRAPDDASASPPPPSGSIDPRLIVRDTFARQETDGWGSADVGGTYLLIGRAADFAVDDGRGSLTVTAAGEGGIAMLPDIDQRDVDITFSVRTGGRAEKPVASLSPSCAWSMASRRTDPRSSLPPMAPCISMPAASWTARRSR